MKKSISVSNLTLDLYLKYVRPAAIKAGLMEDAVTEDGHRYHITDEALAKEIESDMRCACFNAGYDGIQRTHEEYIAHEAEQMLYQIDVSLKYCKDSKTVEALRTLRDAMTAEDKAEEEDEQKPIAAADGREAPAKADSEKPAQSKPAQNKFGVKVGDLFSATWGYEQTNADFFQVVALVGAQSVRVRQVYPPLIEEDATGPMSADRTYKTSGLPILPPAPCSVFIKDQENGDLKRLKSYDADGKGHPLFYLASFANAHHCTSDTEKLCESWYA